MADNVIILNTLLQNLRTLINSSEVKFRYYAKQYETLEISKEADKYIDAIKGKDSFLSYKTFYPEAVKIAYNNTITYEVAKDLAENPGNIDKDKRNKLVEAQRKLVIDNYVERNDYYRRLIGLPPINEDPDKYVRVSNRYFLNAETKMDDPDEFIIYIDQLYNSDSYISYDITNSIELTANSLIKNIKTRYSVDGNTIKVTSAETNYLRLSSVKPIKISYYGVDTEVIQITETLFLKVDKTTNDSIENIHGAVPIKFVHNITDDNVIYNLEEHGVLKELQTIYPDAKYIKFITTSNKKIKLFDVREASNFALIKIDKTNIPDGLYAKFIQKYDQCREYFTTVIYNFDLASTYYLYDNFIGLAIMIMTIQQMITDSFKSGIERDFYDWDFIQNIYKAYNIPFIDNLPMEYHIILLKNLNNLLRYKSTDKVLVDLASILGYNDIIYKYILVREHVLDDDENPIFYYKEDGTPDYEKMYDVYFQAVDINERDIVSAVANKTNRYEYDTVVSTDPYWQDDENTQLVKYGIGVEEDGTKYNSAYNYVETKYLGFISLYSMTKVLFEFIYAYGMILDKKSEIDNVNDARITLPKLDETETAYPLVDCVILLMAFNLKLHNVDYDETPIPTTASQVSSIYGFNFNKFDNDAEFKSEIKEMLQTAKKNGDIASSVADYFITNNLKITKAEDINTLYDAIKKYDEFLVRKIDKAKTLEDYKFYRDMYTISMVTESQSRKDLFLDEYNNQYTYGGYLSSKSPFLYSILKNTEYDDILTAMSHITTNIETIVSSIEHGYVFHGEESPTMKALTSLISFFKSYTVDLASLNIIYQFDSKATNKLFWFEKTHIDKHNIYKDSLHMLYFDEISTVRTYG